MSRPRRSALVAVGDWGLKVLERQRDDAMTKWTPEAIRERVAALGDWFHNLDLNGVRTAPNHFLYDYPNNKFSAFAHALPADLTGKSVLDIGCNGGFYSLEMKRRGATRVVGIDSDERYLAQARFAAEVGEHDIEFRNLSVYDVARLGETVRPRAVHGRVLPPAPSAFSAGSLARARRARPAGVPVHAAGLGTDRRGGAGLRLLRRRSFRQPRLSEAAFHRALLCARSHQLVGAQRRGDAGDVARRRFRDRIDTRRTKSIFAGASRGQATPALSIRRAEPEGGSAMIEAVKIWNEPNNKSHWDPMLDPEWALFSQMTRLAGQAIGGGERLASPRVLGGMSPIDPAFIRRLGPERRARPCRRRRRARFPP